MKIVEHVITDEKIFVPFCEIHSLLVTYTDSYSGYFDTLVPHFYGLIQQTRTVSDRQWALCVFDDVIQFTGAHSHHYAQFFLSSMAESLADAAPKIRQASAYGFGVMGMNGGPVYARACAEALPRLTKDISCRIMHNLLHFQN